MVDGVDWTLTGFTDHFDRWVSLSEPSGDLRIIVLNWIMTRHDDPYQGVDRESGFDNLWYGRIPHSGDGCGNVVVCSYWVEAATHTVRCNGVTTLGYPV